jgi:hypothetical protein
MLNFADKNVFFENCLVQCGITDGRLHTFPNLETIQDNPKLLVSLVRTLEDVRAGADALFEKGKPAENTLGLDMVEWERRWAAWSAARSAAFHSRAALFMLGQRHYLDYFLQIIRRSQNAVFLSGTSDLLQHSSGHYLSGTNEYLSHDPLATYWQKFYLSPVESA